MLYQANTFDELQFFFKHVPKLIHNIWHT